MLDLEPKIVVFDTEYTSWEGAQERDWKGENEYREIVEIGAVLIDTTDFSEIDSFKVFVMPIKNPKLSDYFKKLTGIAQETLDREGIDLNSALNKFSKFCGINHIYSWGEDQDRLMENCELINIEFPMDTQKFFNVRDMFIERGIKANEYMSSTIIKAFGKEPIRRGHDSLNDARSIVDAMGELSKIDKKK